MVALKPSSRVLVLLLLAQAVGCQPPQRRTAATGSTGKTQSAWLSEIIRALEQAPVANPPAKLYRYFYNGQEVYYLTSRCCDIPGKVYDTAGNLLCEPDGGITGQGDGRCTDFAETRANETLIWEDKRES